MEPSDISPTSFFALVLTLQAISFISMAFDIPFVRQVSGFLFLTIVPGLVLLRIFKLKNANLTELALFSVGISIACLMLVGIIVNELGSLNLISRPLSTETLSLAINTTVALMCIFSYVKDKGSFHFTNAEGPRRFSLVVPHIILPLLGVVGVLFVLDFNNTLLLTFVIIGILVVFILSLFHSRLDSYYPVILVSLALTLLLSTTLISRYMYGPDIGFEFSGFTATKNMSFWNRQDYSNYDQYASLSMASVTVLPTIYSNLLNLDGGWVFKIVFPIILSLVPLGLYQLYRVQWGKKVAFISAFFFMVNYVFFQVLIMVGKQMIAELFYVLIFLVMLKKGIKDRSSWIIMLFLSFGLIVSHYGMNYILLFTIVLTFLLGKIFLKNHPIKIKSTIIAASLCLTFLWYINVVQGPFEKLAGVVRSTLANLLSEFLLPASRGQPVQSALGIISAPSTLHNIGTIIFDATMFLILLGFIYLLFNWRKGKVANEYTLIISLNMFLLFSAIVIPRFAGFLEMGRLYQIVLLFLSPLFALGVKFLYATFLRLKVRKRISNVIEANKKKGYFLLLASIILVPFFIFQTGLIYEIADDPVPSSISLSKSKLENSTDLIHESDVFSASWLCRYGDVENILTYSDTVSLLYVLTSYSTIDRSMISVISNDTTKRLVYPGIFSYAIREVTTMNMAYIYLGKFNVETGEIVYNTKTNTQYAVSELPIFNSTGVFINKIYSNGASEIYTRTT